MHPRVVPIGSEILTHLYVEERLTADQIATRVGCSAATILRRLRKFGIPARPRGPQLLRDRTPRAWSAKLAWVIGVMATDGNLSSDGRHLSVTSKDRDLLESVRDCLALTNSITRAWSGFGGSCCRLQWSDRAFYRWLLYIGLMPAKSLRLGSIAVPDEWFRDFLRGCIDGDGSLVTYIDRYNTFKKPEYVYARLFVSIVSASQGFLEWIRATVSRLIGRSGSLTVRSRPGRNDVWCLKYAKGDSLALLRWMYYDPAVSSLRRKREIAATFLVPRPRSPRGGPGRPVVT